jgi:hypothetical protein
MFTIPGIRVGDPIRHESLTVFPLFAELNGLVEYVLSDEALRAGSVTVQEVSEGGSVPELLVENSGDTRVLFLEGEELVGAKQNRILNTSVLLPARSKTKVPVSCVERRRWAYQSRQFGSSGRHSSSKLRHMLKTTVSESLLEGTGHCSDQGKVWEEVDKQQALMRVSSPTAAMADTFAGYQQQIDEGASKLLYPEGAVGAAVALGDKVVALDLFDKPATCQKVWQRLLSGFILDALAQTAEAGPVTQPAVEETLAAMRHSSWEQVQPVGDGQEYRAKSSDGTQASALTFGDALVHGSLLTGA